MTPPWVRWAALALVALLLLGTGIRLYGDTRAKTAARDALALNGAHVKDSIGTILERQFLAKDDSATARESRAQLVTDSARASRSRAATATAVAQRHAADALAMAAAVRDSVAQASPMIQAAFDSLETALDAAGRALTLDSLAMRAQAFAIDSLSEAGRTLLVALGDARATLAQKDTTIAAYQRIVTPRNGLLHTVGVVGSYALAVLAGAGAHALISK